MTRDDLIAHCAAKGIPVTVGPPVRVRADPPHPAPNRPARDRRRVTVEPGKRAFVTVPVPPSTNQLYANVPGKGRVKTKAYKDWLAAAEPHLYGLSVPPPPWSIRYTITAGEGWHDGRDIGNTEKALTDLLVGVGLLANDNSRHVRRIVIELDPERRGPKDRSIVRIQVMAWAA